MFGLSMSVVALAAAFVAGAVVAVLVPYVYGLVKGLLAKL